MAVKANPKLKKKIAVKKAGTKTAAAKTKITKAAASRKPVAAKARVAKPAVAMPAVTPKPQAVKPMTAKPVTAKPGIDRSKIYLRKVEEIAGLLVWIVDGGYVRGHLDKEFARFGQHFRLPYIPLNELWLDRSTKENELRYRIDHLLTERRLMAKGTPYAKASEAGRREERKERRRAGEAGRLPDKARKLPAGRDVRLRLWKQMESGVAVWIVNGRLVRSVFDLDYAAGGHDYVYEFVPENEIWIDDEVEEQDRGFVLLHELHERNRMALGWPYSRAHAESSRIEYRCRQHPSELDDKLAAEGWR
jgi:hypothetical protein